MQSLMGTSTSSAKKGSNPGTAGLGMGVSLEDSFRMDGTGRESPDFELSIGFSDVGKSELTSREKSPETELRKSSLGEGCSGLDGNLSNFDIESTKLGSPSLRRASEGRWSWRSSPDKLTNNMSVGSTSPTLRKSTWSNRDTAARETNRWSSPTRDNLVQESISKDTNRWSSPTRNSPCRDTTSHDSRSWSPLTRDNDSWSSTIHDVCSVSTPTHDTHNTSPPTHDTHSWSTLTHETHTAASPTHETRNWSLTRDNKSTPSPSPDTRDWSSPARETLRVPSPTGDTCSWSFPTLDTPSVSSPTREKNNWSSLAQDTPTATGLSSPTSRTTTNRLVISYFSFSKQ